MRNFRRNLPRLNFAISFLNSCHYCAYGCLCVGRCPRNSHSECLLRGFGRSAQKKGGLPFPKILGAPSEVAVEVAVGGSGWAVFPNRPLTVGASGIFWGAEGGKWRHLELTPSRHLFSSPPHCHEERSLGARVDRSAASPEGSGTLSLRNELWRRHKWLLASWARLNTRSTTRDE